ncbi:MAG: SMI1/KNR4 family protein, partial [Oscillospiraceae bacterium]|nr:SMI1/KNR4 family protein [Oscillospiraceae bacterium]
ERANTIAAKVWDWVCEHIENIKDDIAQGVCKTLEELRQKREKHVPEDDFESVRGQLKHIKFIRFYEFGSFTVTYFAWFNGARYNVYASYLYDDFTLKNAGILTMGGFSAPKTSVKSAPPAKREVTEDITLELVKAFDEDEDFLVCPMAPKKCTADDIKRVENVLGLRLPEEYVAHVLGDIAGGVYIEATEEAWPKRKGGGAAWEFFYGLHTFSPSSESEDWMQLEAAGKNFQMETGLKAVPILKIISDPDLYVATENGTIARFSHEDFELTETGLDFWQLLERELDELNKRKEMMKANNV